MTIKYPALLLALAAASAHAQTRPATPAAKPPAAAAPAAKAPAAPSAQMPSPESIFAEWDTDKNKQLSVQEFSAGVQRARVADMIGQLEVQFRRADTNGSKKLEAGEYAELPPMKRAGATAPPMATFDTNKDQGIDFKEFLAMVQAFMRASSTGK